MGAMKTETKPVVPGPELDALVASAKALVKAKTSAKGPVKSERGVYMNCSWTQRERNVALALEAYEAAGG